MAEDSNIQVLQDISYSLQQIVKLLRVVSYPTIKQILENNLDTPEKRAVYNLLDGTRGVKAIQEQTGVNVRYISEWGQKWEELGIVEPSIVTNVKGRRQKAFELSTFGVTTIENPPGVVDKSSIKVSV